MIARFVTAREEGQTLVEYALIIALISLLVIGLALIVSPALTDVFTDIANALTGGGGGAST
jgi:Flp pilus assembly pilin Flp